MIPKHAILLLLAAGLAVPCGCASVHAEPASAATDEFVEPLLGQLTLEEKVGQMIQADIASIAPADLGVYPLGSILAGGNAAPGNHVRATPQAWRELTDEFHRAALGVAGGTPLRGAHVPIPLLFGIDAVHGNAKLVGATIFPHNVGLGAAQDADLIRRIGHATAAEVAAIGVDWTFAPTVAVARDVRWGRSYESYSESPALVAGYAAAMVTGLQGERGTADFMTRAHTLSSVKHFIGDGGTLGGRDQGNTVVSDAVLERVHAAGYPAAIGAGALIVMASYNSWNGTKLHADHHLLTDILKGRMGFSGFVVGDWNAHEQIPGCTKSSCPAAILAGVDMLMAPDEWRALYGNTLAQVRSGEIPRARIDDAVRRILRVKAIGGLFERAAHEPRSGGADFAAADFAALGSTAHRAIAREAVAKSLVLLKNAHHTLPLSAHGHILVAGAAADDIGMQSGGWTIDWQGDHNSNADFPGATSIFAGIQAAVSAAGGTAELRRDGRFTRRPDAAVVVFGEGPYAEFEGDRETLEYSPGDKADLTLLRRLHKQGIPTVAVFISGRPLWVNPEINAADAFVAAWLPGSEGGGIADVLLRAPGAAGHDFTGRLAFSWPATAMPVTFDAADQERGAQFARGYGLTYTDSSALPALPVLSEEPHIPAHWRAPEGSLFHAQHVTAPWSIFVADRDAEVHLTNERQASPHGAVDAALTDAGLALTWPGTEEGMLRISGRASDLRAPADLGLRLVVRYRVERAPDEAVRLGMRCTEPACGTAAGAMLEVTRIFKTAAPGVWRTLSIPVSCFSAAGANLAAVEVPLAIATHGRFALTLAQARLSRPATRGVATRGVAPPGAATPDPRPCP